MCLFQFLYKPLTSEVKHGPYVRSRKYPNNILIYSYVSFVNCVTDQV